MSHPLLFLRPAAQGFAVTLLVALAGCGLSSSPDLAKPTEPVAERKRPAAPPLLRLRREG
ncbi:Ca-activated chloride channel family protein [Pseudomonas marginalis]|nr:Ca-activated chloride channel family protein [Pseudomonas marginalis]